MKITQLHETTLRNLARAGLQKKEKDELLGLCMLLGDYKEMYEWAEQAPNDIIKQELALDEERKQRKTKFQRPL
jgi:hypothetical protein